MAKKKLIPTIDVVYDSEELTFHCDGEPLEDMDFTWEDLDDSNLLLEIADELVEYLDTDDVDDVDNPTQKLIRSLKKLRATIVGAKSDDDEDDLDEDELDDDDDDD